MPQITEIIGDLKKFLANLQCVIFVLVGIRELRAFNQLKC